MDSSSPLPAWTTWLRRLAPIVWLAWAAALLCWIVPGFYPPTWPPIGGQAIVAVGLAAGAAWGLGIVVAARGQGRQTMLRAGSWAYPFLWAGVVALCDLVGWRDGRVLTVQVGQAGLFLLGLGWVVWVFEQSTQAGENLRRTSDPLLATTDARPSSSPAAASSASPSAENGAPLRPSAAEPKKFALRRGGAPKVWNPLDAGAWYFGRESRFNQSAAGFVVYSIAFLAAVAGVGRLGGCREMYEMPAGGGEAKPLAQRLQIQKVIRKKYVVNPYSSIIFRDRQIEEVKLQLQEMTAHQYAVGFGKGEGAGFAGGTKRGKVRFIRLEYAGGDWNQDFGAGADLNMLIEYGVRTSQKVESQTESRTIAQLKNFPLGASPPVVYLTGERNIQLSKSETEILREYLLQKHGMLFGDNGGSRHFHNQFLSMMSAVLPNVQPVSVPLDDRIHRIPYSIPFLPIVAPHGGKEALGWKVDGRWVCYYHPGDIADAWADGHAGVRPEVAEYCYQLGVNVIFYGHAEYAQWLDSQRKERK